ncbi:MAG: hypothetical protein ABUL62_08080, partial [Myxococcales bacterium]
MRFFTARRLALAALLPVLFSFSIIPGCSKQGEGERCGDDTGHIDNSDCDDGLTCQLIDKTSGTYRCCNPTRITNARCVPVTTPATGGAAGIGGASTGGGENTSGASTGGGGASAGGEVGVAGDSSA